MIESEASLPRTITQLIKSDNSVPVSPFPTGGLPRIKIGDDLISTHSLLTLPKCFANLNKRYTTIGRTAS